MEVSILSLALDLIHVFFHVFFLKKLLLSGLLPALGDHFNMIKVKN